MGEPRDDGNTPQGRPRCTVVGIGASAGGLDAFERFLQHMPADSGLAFVLVQHLDQRHQTLLPEILSKSTAMPVLLVEEGMRVESNRVYVAPPDANVTIAGGALQLIRPRSNSPIDAFFRSLAEEQGPEAISVILSGTGTDGTIGFRAVKERGGVAMVQTPESAQHGGMPSSAISTGLVDHVLSAEEMPVRLLECVRRRETAWRGERGEVVLGEAAQRLGKVWEIIRRTSGHDFSRYKQATVLRRIQRRMNLLPVETFTEYLERLRTDPEEVTRLYKDLLITVTQFFRDPELFAVLAAKAISVLFASSPEELRIWVPGCATGEEAYSLAVLVCEEAARAGVTRRAKIFATDIDAQALAVARRGEYPAGIADEVTPERLERFFVRQGDLYRVAREVREMCTFSQHHLIQDPPFSRLDLVSCRNLLIYLETAIQKKIIPLFHYALRTGGYLVLGPAEGVGEWGHLFQTLDKKHRVFKRREALRATIGFPLVEPVRPPSTARRPEAPPRPAAPQERSVGKAIERVLLRDHAPAAVAVDERGKALFFSGRAGSYLEPPVGEPSDNLLDLARKELRLDLRTALHKAVKENGQVLVETSLSVEGASERIRIAVGPLRELEQEGAVYLVTFQRDWPGKREAADLGPPPIEPSEATRVGHLESELRLVKSQLESTIVELGTSNEQAKASNEELVSVNEEVQSANEELQTSQEELQSLNEELETVNAELSKKVEELDRAHSDLQNLFQSTQIATIFLGRDLRIRKFTPAATKIFNLIETDLGRPISDIAPRFPDGDVVPDVREVLRTLAPQERSVRLADGQAWFIMRVLPYRTLEDVIDGVVVTFGDVTELKRFEDALRRSEESYRALAEAAPDLVWATGVDGRADYVNSRWKEYTGIGLEELQRVGWQSVNHPDDAEEIAEEWCAAARAVRPFEGESRYRRHDGSYRWFWVRALPITGPDDRIIRWIGIARDIEERKNAQEERERLLREEASARHRAEALGSVSAALISGKDLPEVIRTALVRTIEAVRADDASLFLFEPDGRHLRGAYEIAQRGRAEARVDIADWTTARRAMESRKPAYIRLDETSGAEAAWLQRFRIRSTLAVPLLVGDHHLGLLFLNFDEGREPPSSQDVGFAEAVAAQCAIAMDRAASHEAASREAELRERFMAILGHDMRNPLHAIGTTVATILKQRQAGPLESRSLARIQRSVERMTHMIRDLLDFSRSRTGGIPLAPRHADLREIASRAVEEYRAADADRPVTIEAEGDCTGQWDPDRLQQVLSNLLGNAVQYGLAGKPVRVIVVDQGESVRLEVHNEGTPIPPEQIPNLFEPFRRARGHDQDLTAASGLGLGLFIVRETVHAHGGSVDVSSNLEGGTSFTVTLPKR